jgi:hypothetical protein
MCNKCNFVPLKDVPMAKTSYRIDVLLLIVAYL